MFSRIYLRLSVCDCMKTSYVNNEALCNEFQLNLETSNATPFETVLCK